MSKLVYNQDTGEVSLMLQISDPEMEEQIVRLNTPEMHAVMDAPDIYSPEGISIDTEKHKIKLKA